MALPHKPNTILKYGTTPQQIQFPFQTRSHHQKRAMRDNISIHFSFNCTGGLMPRKDGGNKRKQYPPSHQIHPTNVKSKDKLRSEGSYRDTKAANNQSHVARKHDMNALERENPPMQHRKSISRDSNTFCLFAVESSSTNARQSRQRPSSQAMTIHTQLPKKLHKCTESTKVSSVSTSLLIIATNQQPNAYQKTCHDGLKRVKAFPAGLCVRLMCVTMQEKR